MNRFSLIPEVHLILEKDDSVLLLRRYRTGYEDGNYSLVAGHMDGGETARAAMLREAREETGIDIAPDRLEFVHLVHRWASDERMSLFFRCRQWTGAPQNMEPHKCDDLSWFAYDSLPENLVAYVGQALNLARRGVPYSEMGWPSPT